MLLAVLPHPWLLHLPVLRPLCMLLLPRQPPRQRRLHLIQQALLEVRPVSLPRYHQRQRLRLLLRLPLYQLMPLRQLLLPLVVFPSHSRKGALQLSIP